MLIFFATKLNYSHTSLSTSLLYYYWRWEKWDKNINALKDVSGPCENGTTCIFEQKDGTNFAFTLSNVEQYKSITFKGKALGNTIKAEGNIVITPVDNFSTRIEYSFELSGGVGFVIAILRKKEVVNGTEAGLQNMVRLCNEAQQSDMFTMN